MKKLMVVLFVALFPVMLFASDLNNRVFTGPEAVMQALTGSFAGLENPTCITQYVRRGGTVDLYLAAGYAISTVNTEDGLAEVNGKHIPVAKVELVLTHPASCPVEVKFNCPLK